MRITRPKEWWLRRARTEPDIPVCAGRPDPFATYAPEAKPPLWARLLGKRYRDSSYRFRWGEIAPRSWQIGVEITGFSDDDDRGHPWLILALLFVTFYIRLPWRSKRFAWNMGETNHYGFRLDLRGDGGMWVPMLWLRWGRKFAIIYPFWMLEHVRTEYLGADGEWHPQLSWREQKEGAEAPKWSETWPYHYMLDSGEVQTVQATVTRRRAFYGWRWFGPQRFRRWLRSDLPQKKFDSIDISFSDEVGERRGSWKGGTVGCGYDLKPGEGPRQALMRMQRERRFR